LHGWKRKKNKKKTQKPVESVPKTKIQRGSKGGGVTKTGCGETPAIRGEGKERHTNGNPNPSGNMTLCYLGVKEGGKEKSGAGQPGTKSVVCNEGIGKRKKR